MFYKPNKHLEPKSNDSCTCEYQKHEPSGFCLYLKGLDGLKKCFNPIHYTKQADDEESKPFHNSISMSLFLVESKREKSY